MYLYLWHAYANIPDSCHEGSVRFWPVLKLSQSWTVGEYLNFQVAPWFQPQFFKELNAYWMATPEQSTQFSRQYYVLKLPSHFFTSPATGCFLHLHMSRKILLPFGKCCSFWKTVVLYHPLKQKFCGQGKLLAVQSYHFYSKSHICTWSSCKKKHFGRTGKERQNSNKDKSREWRKQTDQ